MAIKKHLLKTFVPISAVAAVFGLAATSANAQTTPVFEYNFPASWNGTGTTVTDQSTAGNDGVLVATPSLSASVPSGAPGGTQSINTSSGGVLTDAISSLNNSAVAAAGGFSYNVSFKWDGTDTSGAYGGAEKLIDYAGTESLQLVVPSGAANASLQMTFGGEASEAPGVPETVAVSTTVLPNVWYNVTLTFGDTSLSGSDLSGTANLYVNGSLVSSGAAIKGDYGDSLNRPIGIGQLGANFGYLVGFKGYIYDPSVVLGVVAVPEPATLALGALGGLGLMLFRRRKV